MAVTPVYELRINSVPYYLVDMEQVRNAIATTLAGVGNYSFSWKKVTVRYSVSFGSSLLGIYDTEAAALDASKGPIVNFTSDTGTFHVTIEKIVADYTTSDPTNPE